MRSKFRPKIEMHWKKDTPGCIRGDYVSSGNNNKMADNPGSPVCIAHLSVTLHLPSVSSGKVVYPNHVPKSLLPALLQNHFLPDPICWFYRDNITHMKTALMNSTPGVCVAPQLSPSSKLKWIIEEAQLFFKCTLTVSEPFIYSEYKQIMLLLMQLWLSWQCLACILKNNILFNKVYIPLVDNWILVQTDSRYKKEEWKTSERHF